MESRPPLPPFTYETAVQKVRLAEDGWNTRDADESIELILRFVLSVLVTPAPHRSPRELRSFVRRRLLPGLGL